jgi:hypothetical protein
MTSLGKLLALLQDVLYDDIKNIINTNHNYYKYCMKKSNLIIVCFRFRA